MPRITSESCRLCLRSDSSLGGFQDIVKISYFGMTALDALNEMFLLQVRAEDPYINFTQLTMNQSFSYVPQSWQQKQCHTSYAQNVLKVSKLA